MRIILILAAASVTIAAPAGAADAPPVSWGKAGVSFEDYRLETTICLREAERTDLQGTEPAEALVVASRRLDNVLGQTTSTTDTAAIDEHIRNASNVARIVEQARPEQRIAEARVLLQARLDACLEGRGYRRFALTEAQRQALRRLPAGRPDRQQFLHRLASDPAVLAAQAVAAPPAQ